MNPEIPIRLSVDRSRVAGAAQELFEKVIALPVDSIEIEHGFIYKFPLKPAMLQDLAEIIYLERRCCPFLNFKLTVEAGTDFVSLEPTGAEGIKELIKLLFGWN